MNTVYDTMTKLDLFYLGVEKAQRFLDAQGFDYPKYIARNLRAGLTGFYNLKNKIYVDVEACAKPASNPSPRRCSFPGWKTDRTPVGVVCHETGHYISQILSSNRIHYNSKWEISLKRSKKVSGYEPNLEEAFAESMRLFILNPNLLKSASPERFVYLHKICKMKLSHRKTVRQVLIHHPKYIKYANTWVAKI